jgi:hypothetical protein
MRWRTLTVIALGVLAGLAAYPKLSERIIQFAGIMPGRVMIAFLLPATAAVTYALMERIWARDSVRGDDRTFDEVYEAIVFRIMLFVITLHALVLGAMLGLFWGRAWAPRIVVVLFGLMLVGIGDLLPRTRPNLVIGIRTARTLGDRQLWIQTHRIAGYVAVGLGVVTTIAGLFLSGPIMGNVLAVALAIGLAVIARSYRRYVRA